jgi:hypothetical protein
VIGCRCFAINWFGCDTTTEEDAIEADGTIDGNGTIDGDIDGDITVLDVIVDFLEEGIIITTITIIVARINN